MILMFLMFFLKLFSHVAHSITMQSRLIGIHTKFSGNLIDMGKVMKYNPCTIYKGNRDK